MNIILIYLHCVGLFAELTNLETKYNEQLEQNMALQNEVNNLTLQLEEALSIGELYNKK